MNSAKPFCESFVLNRIFVCQLINPEYFDCAKVPVELELYSFCETEN